MPGFTGSFTQYITGVGCVLILLVSLSVAADPAATETHSVAAMADVQNAPPVANLSAPAYKPLVATSKSSSAAQLANVIGGLAFIVVLIFGLSWFVKRFSQGGFLQNPAMKILASMPLGTRERLVLIEVGGQQLLLGVTATTINTLHVFNEPILFGSDKSAAGSDFSQKLMAILQQKNIPGVGDSSHNNTNS